MTPTESALENLRVIRSLMEKAHIYRAISAPAALAGGVIAAGASLWPVRHAVKTNGEACMSDFAFLGLWLVILAVASALNLFLLAREAGERNQPLVSEGMRMALRSLTPPLLVGGCVGVGLIVFLHNLCLAVLMWVLCYGLALLATASFSPRSLIRLGWAFVIAGLALFSGWVSVPGMFLMASDMGPASLIMGLTFGFLHIVYALAVFFGRKPVEVRPA